MRVVDYLRAKYGTANATTILHCEAMAFGIPYPPPHGWTRSFGEMEITSDAAERLRTALLKNKDRKKSAAKGLEVLESAWLILKTRPDANAPEFLQSKAWKRLRFQALKTHGMACQACGASPSTGAVLNVDHIFPRRMFPALALRLDNLQVLCADCNEGKANWDMTDTRKSAVT